MSILFNEMYIYINIQMRQSNSQRSDAVQKSHLLPSCPGSCKWYTLRGKFVNSMIEKSASETSTLSTSAYIEHAIKKLRMFVWQRNFKERRENMHMALEVEQPKTLQTQMWTECEPGCSQVED